MNEGSSAPPLSTERRVRRVSTLPTIRVPHGPILLTPAPALTATGSVTRAQGHAGPPLTHHRPHQMSESAGAGAAPHPLLLPTFFPADGQKAMDAPETFGGMVFELPTAKSFIHHTDAHNPHNSQNLAVATRGLGSLHEFRTSEKRDKSNFRDELRSRGRLPKRHQNKEKKISTGGMMQKRRTNMRNRTSTARDSPKFDGSNVGKVSSQTLHNRRRLKTSRRGDDTDRAQVPHKNCGVDEACLWSKGADKRAGAIVIFEIRCSRRARPRSIIVGWRFRNAGMRGAHIREFDRLHKKQAEKFEEGEFAENGIEGFNQSWGSDVGHFRYLPDNPKNVGHSQVEIFLFVCNQKSSNVGRERRGRALCHGTDEAFNSYVGRQNRAVLPSQSADAQPRTATHVKHVNEVAGHSGAAKAKTNSDAQAATTGRRNTAVTAAARVSHLEEQLLFSSDEMAHLTSQCCKPPFSDFTEEFSIENSPYKEVSSPNSKPTRVQGRYGRTVTVPSRSGSSGNLNGRVPYGPCRVSSSMYLVLDVRSGGRFNHVIKSGI
ncbi:hypothetical protein C8R45DRAFT_943030 [Mycena sanguinolenta]|nr:hypothetical protein C8R45DRAFT_943030 [Mycena sanguinolenta]